MRSDLCGRALVVVASLGLVLAACSSPSGQASNSNFHPYDAGGADAPSDVGQTGDGCAPASCDSIGANCGTAPDGCGGSIFCGTCDLSDTCGGGSGPNVCGNGFCTPKICADLGVDCGIVSNACGSVQDCGGCSGTDVCGVLAPNKCGTPSCTAKTCADLGADCGTLPDGCGHPLDCGACTGAELCGGAGPNKCGTGTCVLKACTDLGFDCGNASDTCGGVIQCGSCAAPQLCSSNKCCTPKTCADLGGSVCGPQPDGCGGVVQCTCAVPATCAAGVCCPPAFPVAAFNATPSGTCGSVCSPDNVLKTDGLFTGLDCGGSGTALMDGHDVTACVGADFGGTFVLGTVVVRLRSTPAACGISCTLCGTGDAAYVYRGTTKGSYTLVKSLAITATLVDYAVDLGAPARYVLVCRTGAGSARDDIVIDSISRGSTCP